MKKRLRKKKHLGEFQELGFNIEVKFNPSNEDENNYDSFYDLIDTFADYSLETGGGFQDNVYNGFVVVVNCGVDIDEQKAKLLEALKDNPQIAEVIAGENIDAWYGDFAD